MDNEDTQRIAKDIEKHLQALASIKPVHITGNNYEQLTMMQASITSELQQIYALAVLTAPQEIQDLVPRAHNQADAIYKATRIEK